MESLGFIEVETPVLQVCRTFLCLTLLLPFHGWLILPYLLSEKY